MGRLAGLVLVLVIAGCSRATDTAPAARAAVSETADASVTQVVGRAAAGALVTLEPADERVPLPEGHTILDQYSKAFVPDTLFVRVGQPVIFKNSEDQLHNVQVVRTRTGTAVFNISQSPGDVYTHTFQQPGEFDVICDLHPGMRATIVAAHTPHAVYADARGAFTFDNIVPGRYRLGVSAGGRDTERLVEVAGARLDVGDVRAGAR